MIILEYRDGVKSEKLNPKAKANMERCANFLVSTVSYTHLTLPTNREV